MAIAVITGALDMGPQCRMSILRNGNVACRCCLFSSMYTSYLRNGHVPCHYILAPMSHVTKPYVAC